MKTMGAFYGIRINAWLASPDYGLRVTCANHWCIYGG